MITRFRALTWLVVAGTALATAVLAKGEGAAVAGRVVASADHQTPIARALVSAIDNAGGQQVVESGEDGRFEFPALDSGLYRINASKAGYLTSEYGARRPGGAGTAITIRNGDRAVPDLLIAMSRGGVLTGAVRWEDGRPAAGVSVTAIRRRAAAAEKPVLAVSRLDGTFRVFGLTPGDYLLVANPTNVAPVSDNLTDDYDGLLTQLRNGVREKFSHVSNADGPRVHVYAPVYFPGSTVASPADWIDVGPEEVRSGLDFAIPSVPIVGLQGTIQGDREALSSCVVEVIRRDPPSWSLPFGRPMTMPVMPDGRLGAGGVPPGEYVINARSGSGASWGHAAFEVPSGVPSVRIAVPLVPAATIEGRVSQPAGEPPDRVGRWKVVLVGDDVTTPASRLINSFSATSQPDGTLTFEHVAPGHYSVLVSPADGSTLVASDAIVNGVSVLDRGIDLAPGAVSQMAVTLSARFTELGGAVELPAAADPTDYVLVVFPRGEEWWSVPRRIRSQPLGVDSRFDVRGLPEGAYRVALVVDVEAADLADVNFLRSLVPASVAVDLRAGQMTKENLRVVGRYLAVHPSIHPLGSTTSFAIASRTYWMSAAEKPARSA